MIQDESQPSLFNKVIDLKEAREAREGQQKLLEIEEHYVPYSAFEQHAENMNRIFILTQDKLTTSHEKIDRLVSSIERVLPELTDAAIDERSPMLRVGSFAIGENADVALVDRAKVPVDLVYTLFTKSLAQLVGIEGTTASRMGAILKDLKIRGNPDFHHESPTSATGKCQKYKPSVIPEIYKRLNNSSAYGIPVQLAEKYRPFLKPKSEVIQ